ncbi:MAG: hypothetical protein ACP5GW_06115 [Caldisericaceae bacterium]
MPYDEEVFVRLTRRQKEFLEALVGIYEKDRKPVSYKDVAYAMGVSKWTAYDIIQELNRKGFLKLEYKLNPGPGRSEVLFVPKDSAIEHLAAVEPDGTLHFIRVWFKDQFKKYEDFSLEHAIGFVSNKVDNEKSSLVVILYTVSLFVLFSKLYNIDGLIDLKKTLSLGIYPAAMLSFVGELMFSLVEDEANILRFKVSSASLEKFNELKRKFRENIQLVPASSQRRVLGFLESIL